jgi:hypothetical protein
VLLQAIEKGHDQWGVNLLEVQPGRGLLQSLLHELQKMTEGIAVGRDGVGTRLALLHQALGKEALHQRRKAHWRGHGRSSQRCSSRRIASRISSGEPLKYH